MARRRQARQAALQLLHQHDLNSEITPETAREMLDELLEVEDLRSFAWQLYVGTVGGRDEFDRQIQAVAENWKVSRMAVPDRNLLRLGIYEMTVIGTPAAVVLDECIELARLFGTAQSTQFVNGILDKLIPADQRVEQESAATEDGATAD